MKPAKGEPGRALARGMGYTKKHAEQDAARHALARLKESGSAAKNEAADTEEAAAE